MGLQSFHLCHDRLVGACAAILHDARLQGLWALALGLFALLLVETVDEVYLRTIGNADERGTVAELHRRGLILIERRPVGQSLAIRISRLGEVDPILLDNLCQRSLCRIFVWL